MHRTFFILNLALSMLGATGTDPASPASLSREKRYFRQIYIPLNIPLPNRNPNNGAGTTTTPAPLPPAQTIALSLINTDRSAHGVPAVTWSQQLQTLALQCAETHATASTITTPCTTNGGAGETAGASILTTDARAYRDVLTQWYRDGYNILLGTNPNANFFSNPDYAAAAQAGAGAAGPLEYTQMIWAATTQVGCARSTTTTPMFTDYPGGLQPDTYYAVVCLWTPAGNDQATFVQNIRPEV